MEKRVLKASPRGFCFGVNRGIKMLEDTIRRENCTVYVYKEIVHNIDLVNRFKSKGVKFVDGIDEIPPGSLVVFSTHGIAPSVEEKAKSLSLRVIDTTCPLVTKVHKEALRFREEGCTVILIGDKNHEEVIGVAGEAPDNILIVWDEKDFDKLPEIDGSHIAWLSQTTLNCDDTKQTVDRLREKYPLLQDPRSDICYATRNRQSAVKNIANECDLFIVVGSEKSSNTVRLTEVALTAGAAKVIRIDSAEELDNVDFSSVSTIGITSGVSVTNKLFNSITARLGETGYNQQEECVWIVEKDFEEIAPINLDE